MRRLYKIKEKRTQGISSRHDFPKQPQVAEEGKKTSKNGRGHLRLWLQTLSDFHKAQCLYSIALQCAALVAIYGRNKNQEDDLFLFLVSADGLVPVALALYTLLLFGHAYAYHIILSFVSALLATITGFSIIFEFANVQSYGGSWPASCGGLSPSDICSYQYEFAALANPNIYFVGGAVASDVIIIGLVLWSAMRQAQSHEYVNAWKALVNNRLGGRIKLILHASAIMVLLTLSAIELYGFHSVLYGTSIINVDDWGFGQIVGITIWIAFIIDLVRHEIGTWK